jgi:hypothetical protein
MRLTTSYIVKIVFGAQEQYKKHRLFLCFTCTLWPSYLLPAGYRFAKG